MGTWSLVPLRRPIFLGLAQPGGVPAASSPLPEIPRGTRTPANPAPLRTFPAFMLNGVLIAIAAQGLVGLSLVWDKILLRRKGMKNLAAYVFWLGAISIFGLFLVPFGFHMPPGRVAGLALAAGFCDLLATWFYYAALKAGQASEEVAATGGFTPLATVLLSIPLLPASRTAH